MVDQRTWNNTWEEVLAHNDVSFGADQNVTHFHPRPEIHDAFDQEEIALPQYTSTKR